MTMAEIIKSETEITNELISIFGKFLSDRTIAQTEIETITVRGHTYKFFGRSWMYQCVDKLAGDEWDGVPFQVDMPHIPMHPQGE